MCISDNNIWKKKHKPENQYLPQVNMGILDTKQYKKVERNGICPKILAGMFASCL